MKRQQAIEMTKTLYNDAVDTVTKLPYPFKGIINVSEHVCKNLDDFAIHTYLELWDEAANTRIGNMIDCAVYGFQPDEIIRERFAKALEDFTKLVAEHYNKLSA